MEFETSAVYIFNQLGNAFRSSFERTMAEIGLHGGQVFILISLWKTDGQNQVEMAKALNLSAPTINKMVKSLTGNGFVECRRCGGDSRMMRVFLTEKGSQIREAVVSQWRKFEDQVYSNLTETEKLILSQLFLKMNENLFKISGSTAPVA